jgi:hypothetical protein
MVVKSPARMKLASPLTTCSPVGPASATEHGKKAIVALSTNAKTRSSIERRAGRLRLSIVVTSRPCSKIAI